MTHSSFIKSKWKSRERRERGAHYFTMHCLRRKEGSFSRLHIECIVWGPQRQRSLNSTVIGCVLYIWSPLLLFSRKLLWQEDPFFYLVWWKQIIVKLFRLPSLSVCKAQAQRSSETSSFYWIVEDVKLHVWLVTWIQQTKNKAWACR